jgi:hypothetical protein
MIACLRLVVKMAAIMRDDANMPPVDWVMRVNSAWLVRGGLDVAAGRWIEHLRATDPERLEASCMAAREMCRMRQPLVDPKPWFYAGLFSLATPDEVAGFIPGYRITKAAVPSMEHDDEVLLWLDRVGDETRVLIGELRGGLERLRRR